MELSRLKCSSLLIIYTVVQTVFATSKPFQRSSSRRLRYVVFKEELFHALSTETIEVAYVETGKLCLLKCTNLQKIYNAFQQTLASTPELTNEFGASCCLRTSTGHWKAFVRIQVFIITESRWVSISNSVSFFSFSFVLFSSFFFLLFSILIFHIS